MADYSQSPLELLLANQQKGYVGIHVEQGVPVLDRDLNLLQDLISATVRAVISRYVGNGAAAGANGFAVQALPTGQNGQDFLIAAGDAGGPGSALVGGVEVVIPAAVTYRSQPGLPALTAPTAAQPDPRTDTVYLDVSLAEVDGTVDAELNNSRDVGVQTSVRLKPVWVVRVSEGDAVPAPPSGHSFYPLASLLRPRGVATLEAAMIGDLRQRRLTVSDMERRMSLMERTLLLPAFTAPAPGQPQFVPKSGVIGQPITLNGSNFAVAPVTVRFGDLPAKIVGGASSTQVVARVPGGLTPGGVSAAVRITVSNLGGAVISDDTFTADPAPAFAEPTTQFSPGNGTPGTQVTLNGFNFNAAGTQVRFAAVAATVVGVPTATRMVVQVPAGLVPAGSTNADVKITVTNPAGSIVSDDPFRAELNIPAPTFATTPPQFFPKSGVAGQQPIILNGNNFNFAPVTVKFETFTAVIIGTPSATQISVRVPAGMTPPGTTKDLKLSVTTAGGTATSTDIFTING
ncbi:IPT/TIG domain-containing protein [Streptomyces sp. NPDC102406]|uniref:IPT/TIG domain-containing protein n=1 Tax=Streptomyces sp. NPDC102406 TaxID=3366171 RepID=UPI003800B528